MGPGSGADFASRLLLIRLVDWKEKLDYLYALFVLDVEEILAQIPEEEYRGAFAKAPFRCRFGLYRHCGDEAPVLIAVAFEDDFGTVPVVLVDQSMALKLRKARHVLGSLLARSSEYARTDDVLNKMYLCPVRPASPGR